MSNGDTQQWNCAAGICCDEGEGDAEKRQRALAQMLHHDVGDGPYTAHQVASWIDGKFDLAGKGTLYAFKQWVVDVFKSGAFQG